MSAELWSDEQIDDVIHSDFRALDSDWCDDVRIFVKGVRDDLSRYTHRNGETDDPKEDGYYWVVDAYGEWFIDRWLKLTGWDGHWSSALCRYYGPIPQPREE